LDGKADVVQKPTHMTRMVRDAEFLLNHTRDHRAGPYPGQKPTGHGTAGAAGDCPGRRPHAAPALKCYVYSSTGPSQKAGAHVQCLMCCGMSRFNYYTMRLSPADQKISWDQVQYSRVDNGKQGFGPNTTRHFFRDTATGANVLYGDGHVKWRPFKEMVKVNMGAGYKQFY